MSKSEQYMLKRCPLFWSVGESKLFQISDELLVETILNYGTIEDVKALFELQGIGNAAKIFYKTSQNRSRNNYFPEAINFFNLYFQRHAH